MWTSLITYISRLEGDALEVIGGMTLTNANYDKAKDILKERYGRQDVIVNAHYKSLVNYPCLPQLPVHYVMHMMLLRNT